MWNRQPVSILILLCSYISGEFQMKPAASNMGCIWKVADSVTPCQILSLLATLCIVQSFIQLLVVIFIIRSTSSCL